MLKIQRILGSETSGIENGWIKVWHYHKRKNFTRVIFNMKYKYIWVVLYSQWFVRIYRIIYIICRTLHVEHSYPDDSHTICTHARTPFLPHACKHASDATHTRRAELVIHTLLSLSHALVNSWFVFFFSFFLSFYSLSFEYNFFFGVRITACRANFQSDSYQWHIRRLSSLRSSLARLIKSRIDIESFQRITHLLICMRTHIQVTQKLKKSKIWRNQETSKIFQLYLSIVLWHLKKQR